MRARLKNISDDTIAVTIKTGKHTYIITIVFCTPGYKCAVQRDGNLVHLTNKQHNFINFLIYDTDTCIGHLCERTFSEYIKMCCEDILAYVTTQHKI